MTSTGMTEAQRVMYGMTFQMDPDPHEFLPCPGAAREFCRVCAKRQGEGKHMFRHIFRGPAAQE